MSFPPYAIYAFSRCPLKRESLEDARVCLKKDRLSTLKDDEDKYVCDTHT